MINEATMLIDKMMQELKVESNKELAEKIGLSAAAVSRWKKYNYIDPIKKKCRELGIYNEIFGDSSIISITQGNGGRASGRDYNEGAKAQESILELEFEETTISLVKDLINKIGEEQLQSKLMEMKINAKQ